MAEDKLTGYKLSRDFFDWCFENPELIRPIHIAIYMFAIEHCNRLGWKPKFGFPTQMTMDAIGIKNWRTYIKAFNDLCEWGFFDLIEKSKNQYSANVIAIVLNTKADTKALAKASQKHIQKHIQKQVNSMVGIDKLNNNELEKPLKQNFEDNSIWIEKFKNDFTQSEIIGMNVGISKQYLENAKKDFISMVMFAEPKPNYREFLNHFSNWAKKNVTNYKLPPR
jgi:hypothetical protein